MSVKKTFEVIEEGRFLKRTSMNEVAGGVCDGAHFLCTTDYHINCTLYALCDENYNVQPCGITLRTCDVYYVLCSHMKTLCINNMPYTNNCPDKTLV